MEYEFKHALHDLDQPSPPFFVQEIFNHGSLESRQIAIVVLSEMGTTPEWPAVRALIDLLRI